MKLLLVDGSALLHRAYHAYPPLTTKTGEVVGAVYGVASILMSALDTVEPTHVVVAWDLPKPTFRHIKYVGYKAQRPKADTEMVEQIPRVKELIDAMGIVQLEQEGFEADDIIGTLATHASQKFQAPNSNNQTNSNDLNTNESQENNVIILTGDQDTMQLVNERVRVLTPAKGANPPVLYGPDEVWNKYGVKPEQIVDYKALVGDTSDNIPGVAGIGPVMAAKLLNIYGNLEAIYSAINPKSQMTNFKLGAQVAKKLADGKESAFMSQDLSRIVTDVQVGVGEEKLEYHGLVGERLKEELENLGFKSLIKRIWGDPTSPKGFEGASNQMGLF